MNEINFKLADQNDIQVIAELHANSWRENYRGSVSDEYLDQHVDADRLAIWSERLVNPAANQWVLTAYSDNQLIGFICLYGDHHVEYGTLIDNLHISNQFKGQGLGTRLMHLGACWAREHYVKFPVYLEVLSSNAAAIGFYRAIKGKQIANSVWHAPCGTAVDELVFQWQSPNDLIVGKLD